MSEVREEPSGWKLVDQTLFGYGSPVTMAAFRIILGSLAFINLCMLLPFFEQFFTERGFYTVEMAKRWAGLVFRFNPLVDIGSEPLTLTVFLLTMVCALLTALGLFGRVGTIGLFVGTVALHHRSPDILHSGDTLARVMMFVLALAPANEALSLDRWWAKKRGVAPEQPKLVSVWPQRLIQFQVAIVYFSTVWWKMMGSMWRDGSATWYPARLNEFDRFPVPPFIEQGIFVPIATWATLAVELALATLVFAKPLRKWVLLAGVGMHAYIEYSMNIPLFAAIIVGAYICHYDGEEIVGWWERMKGRFERLSKKRDPGVGQGEDVKSAT